MSTDKKKMNKTGARSWASVLLVLFSATACAFAGYLVWEIKHNAVSTPVLPETAEEKIREDEPLYFPIDTFTVSLKPTTEESERVLYIGFSVQVSDQPSLNMLQKYLPVYRSRLLMLFTQQTYEDLSTDEGKRQLLQQIKEELSKPLPNKNTTKISDVLINEFILR